MTACKEAAGFYFVHTIILFFDFRELLSEDKMAERVLFDKCGGWKLKTGTFQAIGWERTIREKDFLKQIHVILEKYNTACKICLCVKRIIKKDITLLFYTKRTIKFILPIWWIYQKFKRKMLLFDMKFYFSPLKRALFLQESFRRFVNLTKMSVCRTFDIASFCEYNSYKSVTIVTKDF